MNELSLMDIIDALRAAKKVKWDNSGSCGIIAFNDGTDDITLKISKENTGCGSAKLSDFRVRVTVA